MARHPTVFWTILYTRVLFKLPSHPVFSWVADYVPVFRIRTRDSLFFLPLDPGSVMVKIPEPGYVMNMPDLRVLFENVVSVFWG